MLFRSMAMSRSQGAICRNRESGRVIHAGLHKSDATTVPGLIREAGDYDLEIAEPGVQLGDEIAEDRQIKQGNSRQ